MATPLSGRVQQPPASGKGWWPYHYLVVSRQQQGRPRQELQQVCAGMDFPKFP